MKYVAFLRGINVGKKNLISMKDLQDFFLKLGFENIKTYLRSGNIVFESPEEDITKIHDLILNNFENYFNFNVDIIIKSDKQIKHLIKNNPFVENDISMLYVTFLKNKINKTLCDDLPKKDKDDEFTPFENEIFLLCKSKYHKTKFNTNFFESKLDNIATTRNWKTINKVNEMLN